MICMYECNGSDIKINRRLFDAGIVENGKITLNEKTITKCRKFALKILTKAGVQFPKESPFYDIQTDVGDLAYSDWDIKQLQKLSENMFQKNKIPKQWAIHLSHWRITEREGRNIISRYVTALKSDNSKNLTKKNLD